jgi:gliding motility-associated-like protein
MKLGLPSLFFVLFLNVSNLQAQVTFEKRYLYNTYCADITVQQGYVQSGNCDNNATIIKTNNLGDLDWIKMYDHGSFSSLINVKQIGGNGYLACGVSTGNSPETDAFVLRTDLNGDAIWRTYFRSAGSSIASWADPCSDGGIVITGTTELSNGASKAFLAKLDVNGNLTWGKTYSWSGSDRLLCVKEASSGGFWACGMVATEPCGMIPNEVKGYLLIIRTDANGNLLWNKIIKVVNHFGADTKGRLGEFIELSSGDIIASGFVTDEFHTEGFAISCSGIGAISIMRTFSGDGFCTISGFGSCTGDGNGNILMNGGGYSNGCNFFDVVKLQPNLDTIWTKRYNGLNACWSFDFYKTIRLTPDEGFILSSGTLLKLDQNGEINCASHAPLIPTTCTYTEPAYNLVSGTINTIVAPLCNVRDTIINPQISCNDTSYSGCTAQFTANLSQTTLCPTECLIASADFTGSAINIVYNWSCPGGIPAQSVMEDPGNICYNNPGNYTITFNATSSCGDTTITFNVVVSDNIIVNIPDVSTCSGNPVTLDAGNWPGATYLWSNGANTQTITTNQGGYYTVMVNMGVCSGSGDALVTIANPPVINLVDQVTICPDEMAQISAGNSTYQYLWSDGTQGEVLSVHDAGTYYVTASNLCGSTTDSVIVNVVDNCDQGDIFIPNSFSPNGSGQNDVFGIAGQGITSFKIIIYDRWGELLFTSEDINQSWDGTVKGKVVKDDVYIYMITYSLNDGVEKQRMGRVTVYH